MSTPEAESPTLVEDAVDPDVQPDPSSVSPDDPLSAVSEFLDDFVDSDHGTDGAGDDDDGFDDPLE